MLDSHLSGGVTGNAGAVGSLAMGLSTRAAKPPEQLLNVASLWNLEGLYAKAGVDVNAWTDARALAAAWLPSTRAWLGEACPAIAMAINSAACLLDLEGVIIDGSFGRELLRSVPQPSFWHGGSSASS